MPILNSSNTSACFFYSSLTTNWSDPVSYKEVWIEHRKELNRLEEKDEGNSKAAQQVRNRLIQYWNKLTPKEQHEIAVEYS